MSERVDVPDVRRREAELERAVEERTVELEAERARFAAVVEHIPAGLVIFGIDGRVVYRNEKAMTILRLGPGELEQIADIAAWRRWRTDGAPYGAEEWPLARTMRTGEVVSHERVEMALPLGARIVVDLSTAPVRDRSGRTIGTVAIFHDVTVRERRERAERQFVANAAHELQSPLAAIISAIEVLQAGAKDTSDRDRFLDHIDRETDRLASLVRALLILARAESAVESPKMELVPVAPLLGRIADELTPVPGVEVTVECPPELAVVTSRELLEQAVANVAVNAAKNTFEGRITLEGSERDDCVEIAVIDTGVGIPAAERPRVFDRFYRSAGRRDSGFGLGLAIVRSSIELLGGDVELDSTVGAGTIVRLRLPVPATLVRR